MTIEQFICPAAALILAYLACAGLDSFIGGSLAGRVSPSALGKAKIVATHPAVAFFLGVSLRAYNFEVAAGLLFVYAVS